MLLAFQPFALPPLTQGADSRSVYFPFGAKWRNVFNSSDVVEGGIRKQVHAPLTIIPAYWRE